MGTINFVRSFFLDFAQIVKPLQQMVKQSVQFKWTDTEKGAFDKIKTSIAHAPSLKIPDFERDFILYTFASDDSLAAVLTQKEEGEDEYPISFMNMLCSYPTAFKKQISSNKILFCFDEMFEFRISNLRNWKLLKPSHSVSY